MLESLVPNSEKTAELIQEIYSANQEQANGVEHVNQALQQLDMVTQRNSATAEQVATAAEILTVQAEALQQTTAFFTINEAQPYKNTEETDLLRRIQDLETQLALFRGAPRRSAAPTSVLLANQVQTNNRSPSIRPPR